MVPIEKDLINKDLLDRREINWINHYHQNVFKNLKRGMSKFELKDLKKGLFSYLKSCSTLFLK